MPILRESIDASPVKCKIHDNPTFDQGSFTLTENRMLFRAGSLMKGRATFLPIHITDIACSQLHCPEDIKQLNEFCYCELTSATWRVKVPIGAID